MVLTGNEVKSIRSGSARLAGAFVTFHGGEAYIINLHIPRYNKSSETIHHNPERSKKLLLKKKDIMYLMGKSQEQGLTIVPLSLYTRGSRIKVEIAIAKGKKKYDKREKIKKRDIERDLRRKL